jgi:hypothetical protein
MEQIQTNQKSKNLKKKIREPKVSIVLQNVCDFQKENHTLGYGFSVQPISFQMYVIGSGLCSI